MKGLYSFLGAAVCMASLGAVIKQLKSSILPVYSVAVAVVCTAYGASLITPVISYIKGLTEATGMPAFFGLLFKAVGVSFLCSVAAELCRACGETGLAGTVESVGRLVILLLSLPVLKFLLDGATSLVT